MHTSTSPTLRCLALAATALLLTALAACNGGGDLDAPATLDALRAEADAVSRGEAPGQAPLADAQREQRSAPGERL